jgi:ketosteroid isomerase-like protein
VKPTITAAALAATVSLYSVAAASAQAAAGAAKKTGKPAAATAGKAAAAASSAEDEIKAIEKERAAAATKADVTTLAKYTSDDYTFIDRTGRVSDKQQTMSRLKSGDIKLTANDLSDLKVRLYGNTAVVTGRADVKGTNAGKDMSGPILFTRVYVKKDGRWQSVAFQQTPLQP